MPQLDKVTFLSQFFWLTFFFLGFYFVLLKYFLPKMSRILKFRKKKMEFSREGEREVGGEKEKVEKSYHTLVGNGLSLPRGLLSSNLSKIEEWVKSTLSQINKSQLVAPNKRYVTRVGSKAVSEKFALLPIYAQSSTTSFDSLFSFFVPERVKGFLKGAGKNSTRSFGKEKVEEKKVGKVTVKSNMVRDNKQSTQKENRVEDNKQFTQKESRVKDNKQSTQKENRVKDNKDSIQKNKEGKTSEKGSQKSGKKNQKKTDTTTMS